MEEQNKYVIADLRRQLDFLIEHGPRGQRRYPKQMTKRGNTLHTAQHFHTITVSSVVEEEKAVSEGFEDAR